MKYHHLAIREHKGSPVLCTVSVFSFDERNAMAHMRHQGTEASYHPMHTAFPPNHVMRDKLAMAAAKKYQGVH